MNYAFYLTKKKIELERLELLKIEDRIKILEEKFYDLEENIDYMEKRIENMKYDD